MTMGECATIISERMHLTARVYLRLNFRDCSQQQLVAGMNRPRRFNTHFPENICFKVTL